VLESAAAQEQTVDAEVVEDEKEVVDKIESE
jgi:hypothetical protein